MKRKGFKFSLSLPTLSAEKVHVVRTSGQYIDCLSNRKLSYSLLVIMKLVFCAKAHLPAVFFSQKLLCLGCKLLIASLSLLTDC